MSVFHLDGNTDPNNADINTVETLKHIINSYVGNTPQISATSRKVSFVIRFELN